LIVGLEGVIASADRAGLTVTSTALVVETLSEELSVTVAQ
jgi:hypothetical protein